MHRLSHAWLVVGGAILIACGSDPEGPQPIRPPGSSGAGGSQQSSGGNGGFGAGVFVNNGGNLGFPVGGTGNGGSEGSRAADIVDLRIEPTDASIQAVRGQSATQSFRVFGHLSSDPDTEVELTDYAVFYVPQGYLVGTFPSDGSATFSSRVPQQDTDPEQRGGVATIEARAANADGSLVTATTTLRVQLTASVQPAEGSPEATPAIPAAPETHFAGSAQESFAPQVYYPNDGVLLPPNLGRLEVHFLPGNAANQLYQVRFVGPTVDITHYTRCYSDPAQFEANACALILGGEDFEHLAASAAGQGPLELRVAGSDELGNFGVADSIQVEFASQRIDGAIYYWTATDPPSIVRVDFGAGQSVPETFVAPDGIPSNDGACVGCHALSRQGDKMAFGLGNSGQGQLMFLGDLSVPQEDSSYFTYNGAALDRGNSLGEQNNRLLTASFSPEGDQFVAVAPVNDAVSDYLLHFHSGTTGEREGSVSLPFIPSHPDWSPNGDQIAVTAIDGPNSTSIEFLGGGISLIQRVSDAWDGDNPIQLVAPESGKNRFNPAFFPDGSFLLYSEVDQASYSESDADACDESAPTSSGRHCNGYSDPGTKTWAVAASAGSTPVLLAKAAQASPADALYPPPQANAGAGDLMDTFPRPTPFITQHAGAPLGWFTVSSQRRAGLRQHFPNPSVVDDPDTQALLWMFALAPERVMAGEDGSYSGFFLPFQDLSTSNHMAQWTQRVVSDEPPPEPPPVPPAPEEPPPPPLILY